MTKYSYEYARPSVTATVFAFFDGKLLTGIRKGDADAFPGARCIPGGFLNAKTDSFRGETAKQCAIREFEEEANIKIFEEQLILFHEHSLPDTDPRAHVVNLCYIVNLVGWQAGQIKAGDDLEAVEFISPIDFWASPYTWAFNHQDLVRKALAARENDYFRR